jgi:hypothetical protein
MKTKAMLLLTLAILGLASTACDGDKSKATQVPPVVQLMPDLPGYHVVEARAVQEYIAGLAEGGTLLIGHPELAALLVKVDSVIACYQEVGAINARIFSDEAFPLSAGAVAIADHDRLLDPMTLFRCVGGQIVPFSTQPTLNPCAHRYTLERDGNEFYIIYVGTTQEICHAFCTNLEGCTAH